MTIHYNIHNPKYRDYVIRQDTAADAAAKYEAYRRAGHPLTPEQVVDELVADYAGRHLREEGAIRRLAGENRTLAEWVRGTIRARTERIREKLGRPEPTLEHAQRLWERAFRAAEQHASRQNIPVPLPGPEISARYSIREEIDSSHSEEYTGEATGRGDSEAKRVYEPSPKHDLQRGWGSENPIPNNEVGQELLDSAFSSSKNKQLYNIYLRDIIKFQPDSSSGKWHAYKVSNTAKEVLIDIYKQMLKDGLITKTDYNKLIRNNWY